MRTKKVATTRIYNRNEIQNLTPFMLQYDKLHEVIGHVEFKVTYTTTVAPNHVRPSGQKVTDDKGNTYYVCGHRKAAL